MTDEMLPDVVCSGCGQAGGVSRFSRNEDVVVRGLSVSVTKVLRRCANCEAEFENSSDPDWRTDAYSQYRAVKGMVQPEVIKEWRERYGLRQSEVTALLGWGEVTLGRYEKGALASDAHDRALAELMAAHRLASAIAVKPDALSSGRRHALLDRLRHDDGLLSPEDLRVVRTKYGLTADVVSTVLSIPTSTWCSWENGEDLQTQVADKFLRVLARRPDVLRDLLSAAGLLVEASQRVFEQIEAEIDKQVAVETGLSADSS
jgi:putative zinc finger/helix-turn-helix YgiT family protein